MYNLVENVENVDKMWTRLLFATGNVEKTREYGENAEKAVEIYVNPLSKKNPHARTQQNVYKHVENVDNV